MRYSVLRAFFTGLAIDAVSQAICYALKSANHVNEEVELLLVMLGPFAGSVSSSVLASRFKFRMGLLLSIPASLLMGLFSAIANESGVEALNEFHGINKVMFPALMNFPFLLFSCAIGALLGCVVSYMNIRKPRN